MLLCYGLYVDVPLPLSELVSLGTLAAIVNVINDSSRRIDTARYTHVVVKPTTSKADQLNLCALGDRSMKFGM